MGHRENGGAVGDADMFVEPGGVGADDYEAGGKRCRSIALMRASLPGAG